MSLLQNLSARLEALAAARLLAPSGILMGSVPSDTAMALCDEGEARSAYDVAGVRTVVQVYALYVRAVVLTQGEREAVQTQIEALCAQINAMALPPDDGAAVVQDLHCGGAQTATCDDSGRYTWRVPLWMEVRGV